MTELLTAGKIAAQLGVPLHRVTYLLARRPHLQPAARAGTLRVYRSNVVAEVAQELLAIEERKKREPSERSQGSRNSVSKSRVRVR